MTNSIPGKIAAWIKKNKKDIFLFLIIFCIALLPRIINLTGHTLFVDEIKWMNRSRLLGRSIVNLDLQTLRKGWWDFDQSIAIGLPAAFFMTVMRFLLRNYSSVFTSRLAIALVGSLTASVFYLFMAKIKRREIGVIGGLFLASELIFIGMSRWAHQDVMLSFFYFLTIGLFYIGEKENNYKYKVLSAVCFSLAFLTKINALAIPIILFTWKISMYFINNKGKKRFLLYKAFETKELALPLISAILVFALWPALWGNPFTIFLNYVKGQATTLSAYAHRNIFLGKITAKPPFFYYAVIFFIRMSPFFIACLIFSVIEFIAKGRKKQISDFWLLNILWILIYTFIVSLSAKKLEVRYILAVWPALAFIIGYGLSAFISTLRIAKIEHIAALGAGMVIVFQLPLAIMYNPNYYLYYNSFIGGPAGARNSKITLVGNGEAAKPMALFIQRNFSDKKDKIAFYGHPAPFLFYLPLDFHKKTKINPNMVKNPPEIIDYTKVDQIYPGNEYRYILIENIWSDRGFSPTKEQLEKNGKYRLVYTYKFQKVELGWILVKR